MPTSSKLADAYCDDHSAASLCQRPAKPSSGSGSVGVKRQSGGNKLQTVHAVKRRKLETSHLVTADEGETDEALPPAGSHSCHKSFQATCPRCWYIKYMRVTGPLCSSVPVRESGSHGSKSAQRSLEGHGAWAAVPVLPFMPARRVSANLLDDISVSAGPRSGRAMKSGP